MISRTCNVPQLIILILIIVAPSVYSHSVPKLISYNNPSCSVFSSCSAPISGRVLCGTRNILRQRTHAINSNDRPRDTHSRNYTNIIIALDILLSSVYHKSCIQPLSSASCLWSRCQKICINKIVPRSKIIEFTFPSGSVGLQRRWWQRRSPRVFAHQPDEEPASSSVANTGDEGVVALTPITGRVNQCPPLPLSNNWF